MADTIPAVDLSGVSTANNTALPGCEGDTLRVTTANLILREEATQVSKQRNIIPKGTFVRVVGLPDPDNWVQIEITGYVQMVFLAEVKVPKEGLVP